MSIIPWIRKLCGHRVCQDVRTRLDSRELNDMQDAGRNGSIAARSELVAAMRHLVRARNILDEMEKKMSEAGRRANV